MACWRKISSLKESASAQVATNLCQENGFKVVALHLEQPMFFAFTRNLSSSLPFIADFKILTRKNLILERNNSGFVACFWKDNQEMEQWQAAVDKQCQRLTEGLPFTLKNKVHVWMRRIALEYFSYSRRQEKLFGVPRFYLTNVLTLTSWMKAGRLDEKKVAERLLYDERLTISQRYHMACVYCLHVQILQLWNGSTLEEKKSILSSLYSSECSDMVKLWSPEITGYALQTNNKWCEAAMLAVQYGNRAALMSCWKMLEEHMRRDIVIELALKSVQGWQRIQKELQMHIDWPRELYLGFFHFSNLLSYYCELICFFLSQMNEEQQLTFFRQAFQSTECELVVECYLDWPHQDHFIPTISRLWGIIPYDMFEKCLFILVSKYAENDCREELVSFHKDIHFYDYRNLLQALWKETPEEYKRYVFPIKHSDNADDPIKIVGSVLLSRFVKRSPFQEKDEFLFKEIFCYQSREEREMMMSSSEGKSICVCLAQEEKWYFANWFLQECLPKEEIPSFKKQFIQSDCIHVLCLNKLKENCEKWVGDLIDWSLDLDSEKEQYKYALVTRGDEFLQICHFLLLKGDSSKVDRIINFCVPSEKREPIKSWCFKYSCTAMLKCCNWKELDAILEWNFNTKEEEIKHFKKYLLFEEGIALHHQIVFKLQDWEEVERFYKWFSLSPEEIKTLKKDTLSLPRVFSDIEFQLKGYTDMYVTPLRWCLTDEEMVIDFQKNIENRYRSFFVSGEIGRKAKERFDCLLNQLLDSFRKDVQDETNKEAISKEGKGGKRSKPATGEGSPIKQSRIVQLN
ncbi:uncharacterized protein NPIL_315641 [Nephila pilipes]|uniref:Uncharacterized protein n=1 Tax=Nephila pilipes TaxID=299642 RepID=A0A8X6N225_NEPPI|nr:uncharacterized protein NPIL_315641 [Nephila pilipes]